MKISKLLLPVCMLIASTVSLAQNDTPMSSEAARKLNDELKALSTKYAPLFQNPKVSEFSKKIGKYKAKNPESLANAEFANEEDKIALAIIEEVQQHRQQETLDLYKKYRPKLFDTIQEHGELLKRNRLDLYEGKINFIKYVEEFSNILAKTSKAVDELEKPDLSKPYSVLIGENKAANFRVFFGQSTSELRFHDVDNQSKTSVKGLTVECSAPEISGRSQTFEIEFGKPSAPLLSQYSIPNFKNTPRIKGSQQANGGIPLSTTPWKMADGKLACKTVSIVIPSEAELEAIRTAIHGLSVANEKAFQEENRSHGNPVDRLRRAWMSMPLSFECKAAKSLLLQAMSNVEATAKYQSIDLANARANAAIDQARMTRCLP